jgi:5-methylcytosine-specific restriction endonuclease McrA
VEYHRPSIIRIFKYVNINFHKAKLSRENVFLRDGYECVYCGENNRKLLTLDHVHPQSKGGKDTWENLVTACKSCNNEKDNLTIMEWGRNHPDPKRPHYLMLVKKLNYIPVEWETYLFLK